MKKLKISNNQSRKNNGITLIALVITIVILLILAGITITSITADNGIIKNALSAKERTEIDNEREIVEQATVQAMGKNKRGNIVRDELQEELDKITGEGETIVTADTEEGGYFVKFLKSGRIYKVSIDGEVTYLGIESELITQAEIIANPESNTTPEFIQSVELTVETPLDIGDVDFMLVSAWNQDKNTAPEDSEFQVAQLTGEGRRRTTTVNSSASVEGDYYLWVRVVVGEIEKEECFGPYAIKDYTTLVATSSESESTSTFLGMPIQRGQIQSIEIKDTLIGTGHSLGDGKTYDVTEGSKGKYLGWYEENENGYYDVTIAGEGGVVANSNAMNLFRNIGAGITDKSIEVVITGLEYLDTGLIKDMTYMFRNSKFLELDVSSFNTENVNSLNATFYDCSLIKLDLNNWDISNVIDIEFMFGGCKSLNNLNISNFDTSKVTNMWQTFNGCSSLTNLDLSHFDTSNVTNMRAMFAGCSSLTTLNVSNFNIKEVTELREMFKGCSSLTRLDLSSFNTNKATDLSSMFNGCSKLTTLNLDNFDTSKVTSMWQTFQGCSSLTSLDLSHFNTSKVTNMQNMFYECGSLTSLNLNSFNAEQVTNMQSMFYGCSSLKNIDLEKFNAKKVINMSNMFQACSEIESINLSGFDTTNVTNMSWMFQACGKLEEIYFGKTFYTANVTDMSYMFQLCTSLNYLDLSSFNTSKVTNMQSMFNLCSSLTRLDLSNFNTSNVTSWLEMFGNNPSNIEIITNTDMETWIREKFESITNIHQ